MFENLIVGLNFVTDPTNFAIIIIGVVLGILVGILPGLGSTAAVAIMIPVTFTMTPTQAIAMLGALYAASTTGGSITAILFRVPGESSTRLTSRQKTILPTGFARLNCKSRNDRLS